MRRCRRLSGGAAFAPGELTALIEEALTSNFDVAAAVARIVQADAQSRVAGAALLPVIDFNGNANRSRGSGTTGTGSSTRRRRSGRPRAIYFDISLSASYEIDFWGKNRAALRAAEETAVASRFDREVVALTTVVSGRQHLFPGAGGARPPATSRSDNLAAATRVYNLIKQRFDVGTASALDMAQQESVVNTQRAAIPPLEQILQQDIATLAVLIGRPPETRDHPRRQHVADRDSTGHAGAAVRSAWRSVRTSARPRRSSLRATPMSNRRGLRFFPPSS